MSSLIRSIRLRRVRENIRRLKYVSAGFIGDIVLFLIVNITAYTLNGFQFDGVIRSHSLLYTGFGFLNIGAFYVAATVRPLREGERSRLRFYERFVVAYVIAVMAFGALISLADQQEYQHLMVFTM